MTDRSKFVQQNRSYMSHDMYAPNEGETLTIRDVREVTKQGRDGKTWKQLQIWWMQERPALDLNPSMIAFLVGTYGGDDDQWVRKRVYVFHDPTAPGKNKITLDSAPADTEMQKTKAALKRQPDDGKGPDDEIPF